MERQISEAFSKIVDLVLARGFKSIKDIPGCVELRIDAHWEVAVNGHGESTQCSHGLEVPPYCAYLQFNGWPAGILDPYGGNMADGRLANREILLAALDDALASAKRLA